MAHACRRIDSVFFLNSVAADPSDHRHEADQQRRFFAVANCARRGRFLEQPEQFEHDYDNDDYSNDIEDASVHVGAIIKLGVCWSAFMQNQTRAPDKNILPDIFRIWNRTFCSWSTPLFTTDRFGPVYRITKRPLWRALCYKNVATALSAMLRP